MEPGTSFLLALVGAGVLALSAASTARTAARRWNRSARERVAREARWRAAASRLGLAPRIEHDGDTRLIHLHGKRDGRTVAVRFAGGHPLPLDGPMPTYVPRLNELASVGILDVSVSLHAAVPRTLWLCWAHRGAGGLGENGAPEEAGPDGLKLEPAEGVPIHARTVAAGVLRSRAGNRTWQAALAGMAQEPGVQVRGGTVRVRRAGERIGELDEMLARALEHADRVEAAFLAGIVEHAARKGLTLDPRTRAAAGTCGDVPVTVEPDGWWAVMRLTCPRPEVAALRATGARQPSPEGTPLAVHHPVVARHVQLHATDPDGVHPLIDVDVCTALLAVFGPHPTATLHDGTLSIAGLDPSDPDVLDSALEAGVALVRALQEAGTPR